MRITDRGAVRSGFLEARLKLILLRPSLCVGFAGNPGVALNEIRAGFEAGDDVDDLRDRLFAAHMRTHEAAEFLIGAIRPLRLIAIRHSSCAEVIAGWLGVQAAYAEYQEHYLEGGTHLPRNAFQSQAQADDIDVAARMGSGIRAVVDGSPREVIDGERRVVIPSGGVHPEVGEAVVSVVPRAEDGLLKYADMLHATASGRDDQPAVGGVVPADFGSAERGAFTYAFLLPTSPGVAALGMYVYEAQMGLLYAPLLQDPPFEYPRVSRESFIELVRLHHGITLQGLGIQL